MMISQPKESEIKWRTQAVNQKQISVFNLTGSQLQADPG